MKPRLRSPAGIARADTGGVRSSATTACHGAFSPMAVPSRHIAEEIMGTSRNKGCRSAILTFRDGHPTAGGLPGSGPARCRPPFIVNDSRPDDFAEVTERRRSVLPPARAGPRNDKIPLDRQGRMRSRQLQSGRLRSGPSQGDRRFHRWVVPTARARERTVRNGGVRPHRCDGQASVPGAGRLRFAGLFWYAASSHLPSTRTTNQDARTACASETSLSLAAITPP